MTLEELVELTYPGLHVPDYLWPSRDFPGCQVVVVRDGYQALYFRLSDYEVQGAITARHYRMRPKETKP